MGRQRSSDSTFQTPKSYLGHKCTSTDSSHLLSLLSDFFVVVCNDVTYCNFAAWTQHGDKVAESCVGNIHENTALSNNRVTEEQLKDDALNL